VTLTRSKVKVKVTGLLNFRQLAKPCVLAAMTAAPLRGFLVTVAINSNSFPGLYTPYKQPPQIFCDVGCVLTARHITLTV